ncbi:response regulator [Acuticoccus sediminis]|uniref:Response regulator n=1 Tax=Acuticoccus sediminis TaxID=2184697 RepID=A0A8B2NV13_9HYPH|nr:response regulator [Acuticoccus sediminis]RAI02148.1 response regulator [Acuticoccus sediminis]
MSARRSVVAIVDDDPRLRESVEELLESAGYVARSYASARSLLVSGFAGLDLLITDIGMPDMDGFDLRDCAKEVRPDLPVFLITGRHEIADQSRARGTAGFFRKPFDGNALLAAVEAALRTANREDDDGT